MNGIIKKLKDNLGNIIFPVTPSQAIYMPDGVMNLDEKLTDQDNKIGNLSGLNTTDKTSLVGATNEIVINKRDKSVKLGKSDLLSDLDLNVFDEATRAILQGLTVGQINAVLGAGNVTDTNIADDTISIYKTNYKPINNGVASSNLFNKNYVNLSKYIDYSNGLEKVPSTNPDTYSATLFIPVYASTIYTVKHMNQLAFYDSNKNYISGISVQTNATYTFTTPSNAKYIKMTVLVANLNTQQINLGSTLVEYESFGNFVDINNLSKTFKTLVNSFLAGIPSKNLFNKNDVTNDSYVRYNNGTIGTNTAYVLSNYIKVTPSIAYSINWFDQIAFFDANYTYISGVSGFQLGNTTVTAPANAVYIRLSVRKDKLSVYQLEQGSVCTTYDSYGSKVTDSLFTPEYKATLVNRQLVSTVMSVLTNSSVTTHIKLIGDSITAGVGGTSYATDGQVIYGSFQVNTSGHCWANTIKTYFESKFNCSVKNFGISGRTSSDLVANINSLVESTDDIVICMIGTNDRNTIANTSKDQFASNLGSIITSVQNMGKKIILMSNIPASVANETDGQRAYHMEDVDTIIMSVASKYNMEYISLYKEFMNYCDFKGITIDSLLSDGLHPNDTGYDVMFSLVCDKLGVGRKRVGATW